MTKPNYSMMALSCENDSLRERYQLIKEKAAALSDAVEKYTQQGISRSMLLLAKRELDQVITPPRTNSINP